MCKAILGKISTPRCGEPAGLQGFTCLFECFLLILNAQEEHKNVSSV